MQYMCGKKLITLFMRTGTRVCNLSTSFISSAMQSVSSSAKMSIIASSASAITQTSLSLVQISSRATETC